LALYLVNIVKARTYNQNRQPFASFLYINIEF